MRDEVAKEASKPKPALCIIYVYWTVPAESCESAAEDQQWTFCDKISSWIVSWVEFKHAKLDVVQNIFHNLSLLCQFDDWYLFLGAYFTQLYFASLVQHPTKQFGRSDVLPLNCEGSWSSQVRQGQTYRKYIFSPCLIKSGQLGSLSDLNSSPKC